MSLLVESTVKVSLIMALALAAVMLTRGRSAAFRHWVLSTSIVCAMLTPALSTVVPAWNLALDRRGASSAPLATALEAVVGGDTVPPLAAAGGRDSSSPLPAVRVRLSLIGIWLAGALAGVGMLLVGLGRLSWLARSARRITDARLNRLAGEISRAHGLRGRVMLLEGRHQEMLVTWGLVRPHVMLPASARDWSDDRARVVLGHELAHVQRSDWTIQIVGEMLRSIYWFNPLVWLACRRLRLESEHACDDAVLSLGVEGTDYADHLLDVARAARRRSWLPAPAMARASSLERRVKAMLNTRVNRTPLTPALRLAAGAAVVTTTLVVAALGLAAQSAFATFSGSVLDSTNAVLPNTTLILTHVQTQAKYEVRSDRTGNFEFVGLRPGDYVFEARLPGFASFVGRVSVAGSRATQNLTLQVGSLEETINVREPSGDSAPPGVVEVPRAKRELPACVNTASVGGNIKPPHKLRDVRPRYPENRRGVSGVVVLDARIGVDGTVRTVDVVGSADPDFVESATEAVRGWEFDQTLLNCVPQEVSMKVTVTFVAAGGRPPAR